MGLICERRTMTDVLIVQGNCVLQLANVMVMLYIYYTLLVFASRYNMR